MRKPNLTTQLVGAFIVMVLILIIGGFLGPHGISRLSNRLEELSSNHLPSLSRLGTVLESQKTILRLSRSFLVPEVFTDAAKKQALFSRLEEAWAAADRNLKNYEVLPRTDEEKVLWTSLMSAWEAWRKNNDDLIQAIKEGDRVRAMSLFPDKEKNVVSDVEKRLAELSAFHLKLGEEAAKNGTEMTADQKKNITLGTFAGVLIALLFGILFSVWFTRPVRTTIRNLSETHERFLATANQIAEAGHQLSTGTAVQVSAIEEAAAITEQLAALVQKNAEDLEALKKASDESATVGFNTFDLFRKAKKATKEIKGSIEETSKIVKTIGEIAFQSMLLALSASIEAARTSEVGIGFAVVAQEVRNLAVRSTEAAKNTSALIEDTLVRSAREDNLMKSSLGGFIAYGEGSGPITELTQTACDTARQQALGVEKMNKAFREIGLMARNNAAIAQEAAAVAEEITNQAHQMAECVGELQRVV